MRVLAVLSMTAIAAVQAEDDYDPQAACELFLAPSTIQGAGLGIFTAKAKNEGDSVGNGDPCLPLIAPDFNSDEPEIHVNIFSNYVWSGMSLGMGFEGDLYADTVNAYWPGVDCAINSHLALNNVHSAMTNRDDKLLRSDMKWPGAGSMTPYRNGTSLVARPIPAGGELFKNYGDNWFISREQIFGKLALPDDYPRALDLLRAFDNLMKKTKFDRKTLYEFILEMDHKWDSRVLKALPPDLKDVDKAIKDGIESLHQPNATRTLEFLYEHGKCIDHIVPKTSSIPHAGEGAFAKRRLPKDTVISGSPILHIPDPKLFDMYDFLKVDPYDPYTWTRTKLTRKQLIMNYCFGNQRLTDMLLCPYGAGVNYLNHDRERANVRIQWAADGETAHSDAFMKLAPEEMMGNFKTNLAIDYIATKDIEEGEELFLDYGDGWIAAWESHVAGWEPPVRPIDDAKARNELNEPIRTYEEQLSDPYPEHVTLRCHCNLLFVDHPNYESSLWDRSDRLAMTTNGTLYGHPCEVLSRNDTDDTYSISLYLDHLTMYEIPEGFLDQPQRIHVPREALYFEDASGTSDFMQKGVFRQPLTLPDHMVPRAWWKSVTDRGKEEL